MTPEDAAIEIGNVLDAYEWSDLVPCWATDIWVVHEYSMILVNVPDCRDPFPHAPMSHRPMDLNAPSLTMIRNHYGDLGVFVRWGYYDNGVPDMDHLKLIWSKR
jgi:hypothetical protein